HRVGGERVRAELPGDGEAERVGATARDVALLVRYPIARAHDAAGERATGAVVVAHLDRALETASGAAVVRPVQRGRHRLGLVAGRVAQQATIVELRRAHDLAGVEQR